MSDINVTKIERLFNSKDISFKEIEYINKGVGSKFYKVASDDKIYGIKICMYPKRSKKVKNEAKIRCDLIAKDLTFIPSALHVDEEVFRNGAVVFDFITGNPPDFTKKENLSQLAKNLSELHSLDLQIIPDGFALIEESFNCLKNLIEFSLQEYNYLINKTFERGLKQSLEGIWNFIQGKKHRFQLGLKSQIHANLNDNCIQDETGKIWLIDWETAHIGDTIDEIIYFPFDMKLPLDCERFFYQEYKLFFEPARNIDFLFSKRLYLSLFPIYNICWSLDFLNSYLINNLDYKRKFFSLLEVIRSAKFFESIPKEAGRLLDLATQQMDIEKIRSTIQGK
ncbi:MAG: hypothetical protein ACW98F_10370 [Candidatus Hodarchaeales archaeon]|jgi:thiamine kinase-like enzyme